MRDTVEETGGRKFYQVRIFHGASAELDSLLVLGRMTSIQIYIREMGEKGNKDKGCGREEKEEK